MQTEYGICCKCGKDITPFDRAEKDCLCKQCFYKTLWHGASEPTPRHNGTRIPTPHERKQWAKWQDAIHAKIDMENRNLPQGAVLG